MEVDQNQNFNNTTTPITNRDSVLQDIYMSYVSIVSKSGRSWSLKETDWRQDMTSKPLTEVVCSRLDSNCQFSFAYELKIIRQSKCSTWYFGEKNVTIFENIRVFKVTSRNIPGRNFYYVGSTNPPSWPDLNPLDYLQERK